MTEARLAVLGMIPPRIPNAHALMKVAVVVATIGTARQNANGIFYAVHVRSSLILTLSQRRMALSAHARPLQLTEKHGLKLINNIANAFVLMLIVFTTRRLESGPTAGIVT